MAKNFKVLTFHYPARPNERLQPIDADPFSGVLGCEGLKRAAVVAIAGGHRMGYYTSPDFPDARLLRALPALSWGSFPCPCGGLGDRLAECTCTLGDIEDHRANLQAAPRPQIFERAHSWPVHYRAHPEAPWADSLEYIRAAEGRPVPFVLDRRTGAPELLALAVERLRLSESRRADILAVAATCARLQGCEYIEACHVAEALQLRVPDELLPESETGPRG